MSAIGLMLHAIALMVLLVLICATLSSCPENLSDQDGRAIYGDQWQNIKQQRQEQLAEQKKELDREFKDAGNQIKDAASAEIRKQIDDEKHKLIDKAHQLLPVTPPPGAAAPGQNGSPLTTPESQVTAAQRILPILGSYRVGLKFGDRTFYHYSDTYKNYSLHVGYDLIVPVGTQVVAPENGMIKSCIASTTAKEGGNTIWLLGSSGNLHRLLHLSSFIAKAGKAVKCGEVIALSGNTGLTTGPHVHWDVSMNGKPVLKDSWTAQQLQQGSFIDPLVWLRSK